ncbi:MAG: hypothetical protein AAF991_09500 [Pseudomonadota bacterium]
MIDEQRYREILDSYGSEPMRWPAELRAALRDFEDNNPSSKAWRIEAQALDYMLDSYRPTVDDRTEKILASLPTGIADRFIAWLAPDSFTSLWKPLTAGAIPLALGLSLGLAFTEPESTQSNVAYWEAEERAMLAPLSLDIGSDWGDYLGGSGD